MTEEAQDSTKTQDANEMQNSNEAQAEIKNETQHETLDEEKREKILKQIEYYFSDINLVRDKFMIAETKKNEGWITADCLMNFGRLKALCHGSKDCLLAALKDCRSDLVEVNPGGQVRRLPNLAIPENKPEFWSKIVARSAVLQNLPDDITLDELENYCSKLGKVCCVHLRRNPNSAKKFLGYAFVVLESEEGLQNFLNASKPPLREGVELTCLSQNDFNAKRKEKKKLEAKEKIDSTEDSKMKKTKGKKFLNKRKGKNDRNGSKRPKFQNIVRKNDTVLLLDDVPNGMQNKQIVDFLSPFGKAAFIEHRKEDPKVKIYVRFSGEEGCAKEILKKIKEKHGDSVMLEKALISIKSLTKEQEDDFWSRVPNLESEQVEEKASDFASDVANDMETNGGAIETQAVD